MITMISREPRQIAGHRVNADLRRYIPHIGAARSMFSQKLEELRVIVKFFIEACNAFDISKTKFRQNGTFLSFELAFSVPDFL